MSLTAQGRDEVRGLAWLLGRLDVRPEVYLASRYRHASETAEFLAEHLHGPARPRVLGVDALTPMSNTDSFEHVLTSRRRLGSI